MFCYRDYQLTTKFLSYLKNANGDPLTEGILVLKCYLNEKKFINNVLAFTFFVIVIFFKSNSKKSTYIVMNVFISQGCFYSRYAVVPS